MAEAIRPPLGIRPQWLIDEQRFDEILSGAVRFNDAGKSIPIDWLIEMQEIFFRAQSKRDKSDNVSGNLITKNYDH